METFYIVDPVKTGVDKLTILIWSFLPYKNDGR